MTRQESRDSKIAKVSPWKPTLESILAHGHSLKITDQQAQQREKANAELNVLVGIWSSQPIMYQPIMYLVLKMIYYNLSLIHYRLATSSTHQCFETPRNTSIADTSRSSSHVRVNPTHPGCFSYQPLTSSSSINISLSLFSRGFENFSIFYIPGIL